MFNVDTVVKIVLSRELQEMQLSYLAGSVGIITDTRFTNTKNPGAFVAIKRGKDVGEEWFIPLQSLQCRELINRIRSNNVLKAFGKI